jgi:hypothetical protein
MAAIAVIAITIATGAWAKAHGSTQAGGRAVPPFVSIISNNEGAKLQVDGRDFMIFGMNWGHMPIGQNYMYSLWTQPDEYIEEALAREMPLLKNMGVNVIRHYVGIPPRWVKYIYERYGIYTVVNHTVGRYGFTVDGVWYPSVDYSDPHIREAIKDDVLKTVDEFQGVPGMLFWLLGNENNYGLSWRSFEIEALPEGEREAARARYLYSLFEEITRAIKERDPHRPVAMANGDLQYIDIIAGECRSLDILGSNVYRGISARDFFQVIEQKLGVPAMFTEFGADAWNAKDLREDQATQAHYLIGQWQEIYEQSYGKGRVGNAIGGFIFQWSDGWWKYDQESRLDIHDTNASWPNDAYPEDYTEGENNMNEEWWGITAKGRPGVDGQYEVYPRAAYYALKRAFTLDPYAPGTDLERIRAHFGVIDPTIMALEARTDKASLIGETSGRVHLSNLRLELETYSTGGKNISTPPSETPSASYPSYRGFDHMQSFYADFEVSPSENVKGSLSINVLGNVPVNPIDEIFYENRGRRQRILYVNAENMIDVLEVGDIERVKVYRASVTWDDRWFLLDAFYRTGHLHWQYEGDFFGLYRDAYYGENLDIYNGMAPVGVEISGKKSLTGLKLAFGPELWWGANPSILLKYNRRFGAFDWTGIFQEDLMSQTSITSSFAIPVPPTRKLTLQLSTSWMGLGIEAGGIWSGSTKVGETFYAVEETNGEYTLLQGEIEDQDAFGAKGKLTYESGRYHWYAQGAYMGLVADGGPTSSVTFTGWHLKDSGSGNQTNFITGLAVDVGRFQIGPNFLWQKPIYGPLPQDPLRRWQPRNVSVLEDPFAVLGNREMAAMEILLTYDQTPASWMWQWDNDMREDAKLAWSLGLILRHLPTTKDASTYIAEDGRTSYAFPGGTPPRDMWEMHGHIISNIGHGKRFVSHFYGGEGEPNGEDTRLIHRYGISALLEWSPISFGAAAKFNDWGTYDYHRDFNLTYPVQLIGDVSYTLGAYKWFDFPTTKMGIRASWRSLDEYSPRYCPGLVPDASGGLVCDPTAEGPDGSEWEIRTYLHVSI